MEMRPGYKQTEVGIVPEEWELRPFGTIFAFMNGVNADKKSYGEGLRFVNVLEPITYSHLSGPEIPGRVSIPASVANAFAVKRGDVLFNRTSETDSELGLAATYLGSEHVVFGGFVIRGRPTNGSLDPMYSGYALRAPVIRSQIIPMGQGAVRANIGQKHLARVVAPIPPQAEQRAIGVVLSDVDALLGGMDRLIAKKCDLKQAAMQQLLTGGIRLPGFHGEWKVKRLGDLADLYQPETIGQTLFTPSGYPVYGANGRIGYYSEFNHLTSQITISCRGNCGTVNRTDRPSWITGNAMVVNFDKKREVEVDFMYYLLMAQDFAVLVTGSGQPQIVRGPLSDFVLRMPEDRSEQTAIAAVLTDMDAELSALEVRRDKTRALKQAMMQELLTGRTRLVPIKTVNSRDDG